MALGSRNGIKLRDCKILFRTVRWDVRFISDFSLPLFHSKTMRQGENGNANSGITNADNI